MKTGWDDAPDYLRSKKKPGPWRIVAILGVGSAITWGVVCQANRDQCGSAQAGDPSRQQPPAQPAPGHTNQFYLSARRHDESRLG